MSEERAGQTPYEILQGMFQAGRTSEQIMYGLGLVSEGVKERTIRTEIGCWDNVKGFFEMANRFYVRNEGTMLTDAELGIHMVQCGSPICKKLGRAYFEVLRPSQETDSAEVAKQLQKLAKEIMFGKPRPDLEGKKSMFYDSQTGDELFEVKVVDVTDKCIVDVETDRETGRLTGNDREVLLAYVPYSGGMLCDIKESYGGLDTSQTFNIGRLSPNDEGFRIRASVIGMDPELLHAVIVANAPQIKLFQGSPSENKYRKRSSRK